MNDMKKWMIGGALVFAVLAAVGGWALYSGGEGMAQAADQPAMAQAGGERVAWSEGDPLAATVYMSPTCGCCGAWVEHLEEHGFTVEVRYRDDMISVKESFGVPRPLSSCHTALVNGYLVEGHVPAEDIKAFLEQAPTNARGLTVPAMPIGSPGMEMGDHVDPYNVLVMTQDGRTTVFSRYP